MFHRVLDTNHHNSFDIDICITCNNFDEIITFLKRHFEIVDIMEGIERKDFKKHIPCAITFDDGWLDNYEFAFPILKKHGVPATIFLCAGMVGTHRKFWFERTFNLINNVVKNKNGFSQIKKYFEVIIPKERLETIEDKKAFLWQINNELKKKHPHHISDFIDEAEAHFSVKQDENRSLMNWKEIREMSGANISFGSHGMNHHILTVLTKEERYYEIKQSKKILDGKDINFVPIFSFPNGNYDQETIDIAEEAGYKILLTASINKCGEGQSKDLRHRINISNLTPTTLNQIFYQIIRAKIKNRL